MYVFYFINKETHRLGPTATNRSGIDSTQSCGRVEQTRPVASTSEVNSRPRAARRPRVTRLDPHRFFQGVVTPLLFVVASLGGCVASASPYGRTHGHPLVEEIPPPTRSRPNGGVACARQYRRRTYFETVLDERRRQRRRVDPDFAGWVVNSAFYFLKSYTNVILPYFQ